jgi:hypothetical protein
MKKNGGTLINNFITFVLATMFIIILVIIIVGLYPSNYNINEEYSEAQLIEIEKLIEKAEETGSPQKHLIISPPKGSKHFLVYFGDENFVKNVLIIRGDAGTNPGEKSIEIGGEGTIITLSPTIKTFSYTKNSDDNSLCLCYFDGNSPGELKDKSPSCSSCVELNHPISNFKTLELGKNQLLTITKSKTSNEYEITPQ